MFKHLAIVMSLVMFSGFAEANSEHRDKYGNLQARCRVEGSIYVCRDRYGNVLSRSRYDNFQNQQRQPQYNQQMYCGYSAYPFNPLSFQPDYDSYGRKFYRMIDCNGILCEFDSQVRPIRRLY